MSSSKPTRKMIRLSTHDYSSRGFYFLTFNTAGRMKVLSEIINEQVYLTEAGLVCDELLRNIHDVFECFYIDSHVIMPDHIHVLLEIGPGSIHTTRDFLRWFKSKSSRHIERKDAQGVLWQRGAYDVVVRDNDALVNIREYIRLNPQRWREKQ